MNVRVPNCPPGCLRAEQAARYCGVCTTTFKDNVEKGVLPRARLLGKIKLWLRAELDDAFDRLPTDGEDADANTCDEVFR